MKILYYSMIRPCNFKFFPFLLYIALFAWFLGNNLIACKTVYKTDTKISAATRSSITASDTLNQKQRNGIDFFAEGNIPVPWTLELDFEKDFRFKSADTRQMIGPPVLASNSLTEYTYLTKTDAGNLKVIVYNTNCNQSEKRSKKVEVLLNNKLYTGCGSYLFDYRLNDVWVLENIDNRDPEFSKKNKQKPTLEFDLEKNKMSGYDGCNIISSEISISGNHIKFAPIKGNKKTCPGNEMGKIISEMISDHTVDYYIENARLVIYLINDSKLTFVKSE